MSVNQQKTAPVEGFGSIIMNPVSGQSSEDPENCDPNPMDGAFLSKIIPQLKKPSRYNGEVDCPKLIERDYDEINGKSQKRKTPGYSILFPHKKGSSHIVYSYTTTGKGSFNGKKWIFLNMSSNQRLQRYLVIDRTTGKSYYKD